MTVGQMVLVFLVNDTNIYCCFVQMYHYYISAISIIILQDHIVKK